MSEKKKLFLKSPCGMKLTWDLINASFKDFSLMCDK